MSSLELVAAPAIMQKWLRMANHAPAIDQVRKSGLYDHAVLGPLRASSAST